MNKKESRVFKHYKRIIENREFDEYDIMGFLVFLRNFISRDEYPYLMEFCDLIAHRKRSKGIAMNAIKGAIDNGYSTVHNTKRKKGYEGIEYDDFVHDIKMVGSKFGLYFDDRIINEFCVCLFSCSHMSSYEDGKEHIGTMSILYDCEGYLSLNTRECDDNALTICFMKCGPFKNGPVEKPFFSEDIEAIRVL